MIEIANLKKISRSQNKINYIISEIYGTEKFFEQIKEIKKIIE